MLKLNLHFCLDVKIKRKTPHNFKSDTITSETVTRVIIMIEVISGKDRPEWVKDLLEDYSEVQMKMGMDFNSTESDSVIAIKDGDPVGIVMFNGKPSFRINMIHAYLGHDDVIEPMLKSIISMAIFEGKDSVTVHSIGTNKALNDLLYGLGFRNTTDCPCCQREEAIHMMIHF